jgi:hypothetical protein
MRKMFESQLKIGQVDICDILIDLNDRDELPQLLIGLQAIDMNIEVRDAIFKILLENFGKQADLKNGRPGMDLWKILVLGVVRLICNWNFDKLRDIVNNHFTLRLMLGHLSDDRSSYALQTLKDNLSRFTPEMLDKINQVIVNYGHTIFKKCNIPMFLNGAADSFVVETNVHFPTDISLLWDANRRAIVLSMMLGKDLGISDWRQGAYQLRELKRSLRVVSKLNHSTSQDESVKEKKRKEIQQAYQASLDIAVRQVNKVSCTLDSIKETDTLIQARIDVIKGYLVHSDRQIDQIRRRGIQEEKIPHSEKVFSIFEPHTEWISKGKAGVPVELGIKVCIIKDQNGLILYHRIMENEIDNQIAVDIIKETKKNFPALSSCSFDKGFHSKDNQRDLAEILDIVVLPRKGKLSAEAAAIEKEPGFVRQRRKHSAVESAINALENHGLDYCPDHGLAGFNRYVGLAVLARNIQIVGKAIQVKKLQELKKAEKRKYRLSACG